jgi:hypothetical protein
MFMGPLYSPDYTSEAVAASEERGAGKTGGDIDSRQLPYSIDM